MRERRSTIRRECPQRTQYCSDGDPVLRDGRLTTLSDGGLGLLAHEPHRAGERFTVSFTLPGEDETLTTTGIVRWVGPLATSKRWFPMGMEWLPLEETSRFRLETYLRNQAEAAHRRAHEQPRPFRRAWWKRMIFRWSTMAVLSLAIASILLVSLFSLSQENSLLADSLHWRNVTIAELETDGTAVQRALDSASIELAGTRTELGQFSEEALRYRAVIEELTGDVERFQMAYTTLREDHELLSQQVRHLERERARMVQYFSPVPIDF